MAAETPLTVSDLRQVLSAITDTIKGSSFTDGVKGTAADNVLYTLFEDELHTTLTVGGSYPLHCLEILDDLRQGIPCTKEDMASKLLKVIADTKAVSKTSIGLQPEDRRIQRAEIRLTEMAVHSALRALGFTQRGTMRRDQAGAQAACR
jgi:hypothetical protein